MAAMVRAMKLGLAGAACAGLLTLSLSAHAQEQDGGVPTVPEGGPSTPGAILAYYCGDAEMRCTIAPISFEKTVEWGPEWLPDWDTGWIPKNVPELQVRFVVRIPNDTTVKLGGNFQTTWPDALTIATPGDRFSGLLSFDYGLVVQALGKVDVTLLGYHIFWQGNLPYLPNIDFHLLGKQTFDSWAFEPVRAQAFTAKVNLFNLNILGLVGVPSEIAEGGVGLNIKGEMRADYNTDRIVVSPSIVPITTENGTTIGNFLGGPWVEYDVHPEGTIVYDGILHLIADFYVKVKVFGGTLTEFRFDAYDYPLSLSDIVGHAFIDRMVFDSVRVHVPLPDIPQVQETIVDIGEVEVGDSKKITVTLPNNGEGKARLVGTIPDEDAAHFKVLSSAVVIEPGQTGDVNVRFTPAKIGALSTKLTLSTNDPDLPVQEILLRGNGVQLGPPDYGEEEPGAGGNGAGGGSHGGKDGGPKDEESALGPDPAEETSGCGCRAASSGPSPWAWIVSASALGFALSRRRSRTKAP